MKLRKNGGMAMKNFEERLQFNREPKADEKAIVKKGQVRFTVMTSRLIRMEYSQDETFRDQATKTFINRRLEVPEFKVTDTENELIVETEHLTLRYQPNLIGFLSETLKVLVKETDEVWEYGMDTRPGNLLGTCRTLDHTDGGTKLEEGLMSKKGYALVNDTNNFIFTEDAWIEEQYHKAGTYEDLYLFGYSQDYKGCLSDFVKVSGQVSILPRWSLGNWWSRYWEYSQDGLLELMDRFKEENIPLSICIVDMDWHIVDINKNGKVALTDTAPGWTGYTWERDLFPEPEVFFKGLRDRGLKTALNLHPADGIQPHEDCYEEMATFMGQDPKEKKRVIFDITDKKFAEAYFDVVHQPHEDMGVDFWWMDWQQGVSTKFSDMDPLFMLNHLHYMDMTKDESKRPFIFSRWGGLGNHRYPIGFSGDTAATWASLAFQPYLTSTAANVGFGWWSHDIGGHHHGVKDQELYTRWVQYGVFSPIMRLHSTKNMFEDRHPWGYTREVLDITRDYMQLRHALIPYLYTMSYENYSTGVPGILPLYYEQPEVEEAYAYGNAYYFGSQLIVSPYVYKAQEGVNLSRQDFWLPEGDYYDFFTGQYYKGDKHYALYGTLDETPVFAKGGSIIPLSLNEGNSVANPENMLLKVYPGTGAYNLYEDDGESMDYTKSGGAITEFTQSVDVKGIEINIKDVKENNHLVPALRHYSLEVYSVSEPKCVQVTLDGQAMDVEWQYEAGKVMIQSLSMSPDQCCSILIDAQPQKEELTAVERVEKILMHMGVDAKVRQDLWKNRENLINNPQVLGHKNLAEHLESNQITALTEAIKGSPIYM